MGKGLRIILGRDTFLLLTHISNIFRRVHQTSMRYSVIVTKTRHLLSQLLLQLLINILRIPRSEVLIERLVFLEGHVKAPSRDKGRNLSMIRENSREDLVKSFVHDSEDISQTSHVTRTTLSNKDTIRGEFLFDGLIVFLGITYNSRTSFKRISNIHNDDVKSTFFIFKE